MVADAAQANPGETIPDRRYASRSTCLPMPFPMRRLVAQALIDALLVPLRSSSSRSSRWTSPRRSIAHRTRRHSSSAISTTRRSVSGRTRRWAVQGGDGSGVQVGRARDRGLRPESPGPLDADIEVTTALPTMGEHPTAIIGIIAAADNTRTRRYRARGADRVRVGSTGTTLSAGEAFSRLMLLGVQLVRGDVLNMSMGIPVPSAGTTVMMPVEVQRVIVSAAAHAHVRGITCMIAAGNSTLNLDNPPFPFTNSGRSWSAGSSRRNRRRRRSETTSISNFGRGSTAAAGPRRSSRSRSRALQTRSAQLYTGPMAEPRWRRPSSPASSRRCRADRSCPQEAAHSAEVLDPAP